MKTPLQFAQEAGATFHRCGREWGGTWGYSSKDYPNCHYNGSKTRAEAVDRWGANTFGETAWAALKTLLASK
jgi:hypothetical protein